MSFADMCHLDINNFEKNCSWQIRLMAFRNEMKEEQSEVADNIRIADGQKYNELKRKLTPILGNITRTKRKVSEIKIW